jgi:hypothetical protein
MGGQVFIDDHLHRAQHALFFAFGVDDALLGLGAFLATWKIGLHEGTAVVDELLQLLDVGVHVLDRTGGHAGAIGRRATAGAILIIRRGSKGLGIRYSGPKDRLAMP